MGRRPLQHADVEGQRLAYKYATISVEHLDELQGFIDQLDQGKKLSSHETYREYIRNARYALPEEFPEAKSIIAFALYVKLMKVSFQLGRTAHEVLIPPQYYGLGLPAHAVRDIVKHEIVPGSRHRIERLPSGHLKLLAVRSGLAQYGRNNISYVEGMGSFLQLAAFVTDYEFPDEWTDIGMMAQCETCRICAENCPTGAIREKEFVIDAGRCLPLYNEVPGEFPEWIPTNAHNAYIGCMRCQLPCPANREVVEAAGRLPDINEEETRAILSEASDDAALKSAGEKLRIDLGNEKTLQVVSRNMRALLGVA